MKQLLSGCRFRGSFDEAAVDERRAGADEGDEVRCVTARPAVLGGPDELEGPVLAAHWA
jgi:hypothetical protein